MQHRVTEGRVVKIGLDANDVFEALYRHHPAARDGSYVGQWTVIREWCGIDLLALNAWQPADVIGYEVKTSRGDMRSELLEPTKRMEAVSRCTQFYFAVPAGMLRPEEIVFQEPDWSLEDFVRAPCPGVSVIDRPSRRRWERSLGGRCVNPRHDHRGKSRRRAFVSRDLPKGFLVRVPMPVVLDMRGYGGVYVDGEKISGPLDYEQAIEQQGYKMVTCPTCGGKGCSDLSKVEREAPVLWVPKDVGLVEIDARGITIVKRAPKNKTPKPIVGDVERLRGTLDEETMNRIQRHALNDFARWVSNRPDPRHAR